MLNQRYVFFNTYALEITIYFRSFQIKFITEIEFKLALFFAFLANVIFNVIFFSALVSDFSSTGRFFCTLLQNDVIWRLIDRRVYMVFHALFFFADKTFYHNMKLFADLCLILGHIFPLPLNHQ